MHESEVSTSVLPELHDARQLLHELLCISSGCTYLLNAGSSIAQLLPTTSDEGLNLCLLSIGLQHPCVSCGQLGTDCLNVHLSAQIHMHLLSIGLMVTLDVRMVRRCTNRKQPAELVGSKGAGTRLPQQSAAIRPEMYHGNGCTLSPKIHAYTWSAASVATPSNLAGLKLSGNASFSSSRCASRPSVPD